MRKKSTRLLSAALAVCMTVTVLPMSAFASGVAEFESGGSSQETAAAQSGETGGVTGDVVINEAFPDPNFCKYVEEQYDRDKDGKLNQNELARVAAVTKLEFSKSDYAPDGEKIESLEGIEYFTSLKRLYCVNNKLSALDVSKNRELEKLNCEYNQLSALNVSNHPKLDELICNHNQLIELNVSNCPALTQLQCNYNHLSALDVSSNEALWELSCANNQLIELDVRSNPKLLYLATSSNPLSELDVSQNPKLSTLYCRSNQLSELDLKNNKILEFFDCSKNHLTSLNIDGRPMGKFTCQGNSYDIVVDENNCYDLSKLQGNFDASKVENPRGGSFDAESNILTVDPGATEVTYTYNCGTSSRGNIIKARFTLNVTHHTHTYGWFHDGDGHWKKCTDPNCPEPEESMTEKGNHNYTDATDPYCDTCGYVRSMYSVITGENVTAKLEDKVLNVPVAADTKVHLTATVPEGKRFTGWTVKVGGEEKEADTFLTEDANDPTKATFTMPSENVEVTANFASNPTLNPTLRVGDHVTATIDGIDTPVQSGSPLPEYTTVHLTAIAPEGQHFTGWTVLVGGEEKEADTFLTPDKNDPTKATFTMPDKNVEVKANFASNPTLNPTLRVGDHVTATIDGSDTPVPSGSAVLKNTIVHLTAIAPDGQHFTGWTVKVGSEEQKADTFLKTPDENDPTKVTFTMPNADVEVTATFAGDSNPEEPVDPVGPSDTGNIQGAISAVVIGAAAGAIIYEAGTGIYRVINMPGIPMPSNRIELAELLWEHAGKPEPVSTALYSDIDEGDTDAQKAARWAVEQDLMKDDADNNKFHPAFPVSKLRTCLTWNAAKEKGLFDKTEE